MYMKVCKLKNSHEIDEEKRKKKEKKGKGKKKMQKIRGKK
jgi:hypothetical protein